jgi:hypothetical protein
MSANQVLGTEPIWKIGARLDRLPGISTFDTVSGSLAWRSV